ncbi:DUF624 domain-containing protein [Gracilibacillus kekensis]|uniref:Uncharacterized membrane protein YesL n=1 Tax=Gracilibacillus kekensis TaxID=1027249 RepID=A0A1M7QSH8_9BACI|nr:DUF624 domain-containing protein [Gracilibacillus kekensis]SHN34618.1 Uncharacterized membrane protein YesL [Gracilibacillus kekensis]
MDTIFQQYARVVQLIFLYAYAQVLWVLFTLAGLIIFGIFPATYALFLVINQHDTSTSAIFHAYKQAYRDVFIPMNRAALMWIIMLILLSTNLFILPDTQELIKVGAASMIVLLMLCIIHFIYYFKLEVPTLTQIKQSFSHACLNPKKNVGYLCIFLLIGVSFMIIPGITSFFCVSVAAKSVTFIAQK